MRLIFFRASQLKYRSYLASQQTRVSLLSELLIKKELIERMHPLSEDLTVEEVIGLKVRMCWPPRCVIWLYIFISIVQSATTEFKVPYNKRILQY